MNLTDRQSIMAGILIGLGACGFLALGGLTGAIIFAFGLIGVVLTGIPLYTGRAGVMTSIPGIIKVWWWNVVGAMAVGLVVAAIGGSMAESAYNTVAAHVAQGPWRGFLRAVGCGLVIDLSVWFYRSSKSLVPVLFGIPLFIVCGFYHSIADVVYIFGACKWDIDLLWFYPIIVIGNYIGCNVRRLLLPETNPSA
ncbi:MAG: formate/nitrite transporter family protein [Candidatus Cryptobacteroides sp.]|nr:formate/nitrite transporter family protein [Candidatus Cryptobacteroides sp.]